METPTEILALCSDCPHVGYPTDATRCAPCPRRGAAPPPARAEAPEGELERLRAEVTHYREAALEVGCLDGHFVVQLVQTLRAEVSRLNLELEALRKAVVK
jgi:hypothetical protein